MSKKDWSPPDQVRIRRISGGVRTRKPRISYPSIRVQAAEITGDTDGASFDAMVLLLYVIKKKTVNIGHLCHFTKLSYHQITVMLTRAKLGILIEDDTINADLFISVEKGAEALAGVLAAGCMAGIFVHTADDKWRVGDQSDPDGTNWKQHLAQGIVMCIGKNYVFGRGGTAPSA
jgi:hypothetical protein